MSNPEEAIQSRQLWVPGMELHDEYPVPGDIELRELWQNYTGQEAHSTQGVYGVYNMPYRPRAIASIDLCEVVRETLFEVQTVTGVSVSRGESYSAGTWYDAATRGEPYERSVVTSVIQVLMGGGHVKPVEGIDGIRGILQSWRLQGVYVAANTSTLPGCEASTITHTFERDLPDCFDALLLPRNYDGRGKTTKAGALAVLAAETELPVAELPLVHIDDARHHIEGFHSTYGAHAKANFFMPHSVVEHINGHLDKPMTALEAFESADEHFREHGVIE